MTQTIHARRRGAAAALTLATITSGLSVTALADRSWNSAVANGSWNTPANWIGGVLPVSTDNVFIDFNDAAAHLVTYDAGFTSDLSLRVQNLGTGSATLRIPFYRALSVGSLDIGGNGRGVVDQATNLMVSTDGPLLLASGAAGTGTYLIGGSGQLYVGGREYVGHRGMGFFNQSGGNHTIGTAGGEENQLLIGDVFGAQGTYLLSGTSTLNVSGHGFVGLAGRGTFNHSGGVHSVGTTTLARNLSLARYVEGFGTYLLSGGTLNVSGSEWMGEYGAGVFDQSGGTHLIGGSGSGELHIGRFGGARGTYLLRGGTLSVASGNEYVGNSGSGTFTHSDGTHSIGTTAAPRNLHIGNNAGAFGSYSLIGGLLNVSADEHIGRHGNGTFVQSGGTHTIGSGAYGGYQYLGYGTLGVGGYVLSGSGAINVADDEFIGYDGIGRYTQSGDSSHIVGQALSMGYSPTGAGSYSLQAGTLSVVGYELVGRSGTGSFNQSGGSHSVGTPSEPASLHLGSNTGGVGRYEFSAGTLNVNGYEVVGDYGRGTFTQSGGTHLVTRILTIGDGTLGTIGAGTYTLSGSATLNVSGDEYVGQYGTGNFSQSGGTHTVGTGSASANLHVGNNALGQGTYLLSGGGVLNVSGDEYIGYDGTGGLTQVAGMTAHTVGRDLSVGYSASGVGTYTMGDGTLNVGGHEYIGRDGTGTFNHSDAFHTVGTPSAPTNLYLGYGTSGIGRYRLNGSGVLNVSGTESIGYYGTGTFDQSGGIHSLGGGTLSGLYVGLHCGSTGTYLLSAGTLNVSRVTAVGYGPSGSSFARGYFSQSGGVHNIGTDSEPGELCLGGSLLGVGTYLLSGTGVLNVSGDETIGSWGAGTFIQSSGTHTMGSATSSGTLLIGQDYTGSGTYLLSGGLFTNFGRIWIGNFSAPGFFDQSGGDHRTDELRVAREGGDGTYLLSSGTLEVTGKETIGEAGDAIFNQSGGIHTVGTEMVGQDATGLGTYFLSNNGVLTVRGEEYIGYSGSGTFYQSGGTHNVGTVSEIRFYLGRNAGSSGTYFLSNDGALNIRGEEHIGVFGAGTFNQSGGTHTVGSGPYSGGMYLGHGTGGAGTFLLSGGVLTVNTGSIASCRVGAGGYGFFHQSGGVFNLSGSASYPAILSVFGSGSYILSGSGVLNDSGSAEVAGFIHVSGGTATIASTLQVHGTGSVSYTGGALSMGTLDIAAGGKVLLGAGSDVVLRTNALLIAETATLDLADNHMILDYSGAHAPPLELVRSYISAGYHSGAWDGDRIMTCEGDASAYGLGYAGSWAIFTAFPATFAGQSVDDTAVLITHTRYGDANLDGVVNLADFNRLAGSFGQAERFWMQGDFNYDGVVNLQDFNRLAANFGLSAGPDGVVDPSDWAALAAAVPEPAGSAVVLWAGVLLMGRRQRRPFHRPSSPELSQLRTRAAPEGPPIFSFELARPI